MKRIVSDFTNNTSGHGWGMVCRTTNKLGKVLWIGITLLSTIAAIIWVSTIIARYVRYETKDRVEVKIDDDIVFPSVTVCLLYGYDQQKMEEAIGNPGSGMSTLAHFLSKLHFHKKRYAQATNESIELLVNNVLPLVRSNRGFYESMELNEISAMGLKLRNVLAACLYQESECTEEHFQKLVHHEYKNCYTFNGNNINLTKTIVTQSGAQKGLSLTLFLDHSEYAYVTYDPKRVTTATAGVRVIVHEKGTLPDPDNDGFDVEPGHLINVALSLNKRELMKPPWGECADHSTLQSTDFKYTRNTCKSKCVEKEIQQRCGCKKDLLPVEINATSDVDLQPCGKFNFKEWLKFTEANTTILKEDIARLKCVNEENPVDCSCEYNCSYLTYNIETSQSVFPMSGSELDFFCHFMYHPEKQDLHFVTRFIDTVGVHCGNVLQYSNVSRLYGNKIRANFLRLNVYFKDLETKYTIQDQDFTLISMISEIGGVLGIFVGVSIITILEVFILCSSLVHALIGSHKISSETPVFSKS